MLDLRGRSIQYTILQREVDTNRSLYDALLQRYKEVGVAGGIGTVAGVDRRPGRGSGWPLQAESAVQLAAWSGRWACCWPRCRGRARISLRHDQDARRRASQARAWPASARFPRRAGQESFIEELKDPSSIVSEAYSAVVASLRFSTEEGLPKALVVTSTRSGEGKSSTALAVAQNFARRGASVLLIDSDLESRPSRRRPTRSA